MRDNIEGKKKLQGSPCLPSSGKRGVVDLASESVLVLELVLRSVLRLFLNLFLGLFLYLFLGLFLNLFLGLSSRAREGPQHRSNISLRPEGTSTTNRFHSIIPARKRRLLHNQEVQRNQNHQQASYRSQPDQVRRLPHRWCLLHSERIAIQNRL